MADIKVLVVDDSTTMRALFSNIFESAKGLCVMDHAASAAEARDIIKKNKPDVVTLDVEMPGMSGIEFLEEVMREYPLPVVMLSTLTQKGADTSLKALELGAFDCFPKPTSATMEEFARIAPKLVATVKAAAAGKTQSAAKRAAKAGGTIPDDFRPNGRIVALSASSGGVAALMRIVPLLPANCPPVVVVLPLEDAMGESLIKKLDEASRPRIRRASDGQKLEAGDVYIATERTHHAVVEGGAEPVLRLVARDPVGGARPSANLLFASLAQSKVNVVAGMLTGTGNDGAAGLMMLKQLGTTTFVQTADTAASGEAPAAALALGATARAIPLDEIAGFLLEQTGEVANAA